MIIILGAGIIGLSIGYDLLKKGKKVKIFDSSAIKAKSTNASIGMLAPLIEAKPLEKKLFKLMTASKIIWEKLQQNKNFSKTIGLKNNSSLMVALNKDDEEKLKFKKKFFQTLGYKSLFLSKNETLRIEPLLNSNVTASLLCKEQDQVNPILYKDFLIKEILRMRRKNHKRKNNKKNNYKEKTKFF